jgi:hypothetical protein
LWWSLLLCRAGDGAQCCRTISTSSSRILAGQLCCNRGGGGYLRGPVCAAFP